MLNLSLDVKNKGISLLQLGSTPRQEEHDELDPRHTSLGKLFSVNQKLCPHREIELNMSLGVQTQRVCFS